MSARKIAMATKLAAFAGALWVTPALAQCETSLPFPARENGIPSPVRPEDLARLRDIGPVSSAMFLTSTPFGIAPDNRHIAFQIRRADPATNSYCLTMVVIDLRSATSPLVVDKGGELIRVRFRRGSLADYSAGDAQLITPAWSSDGKSIAFLKRRNGRTQVWVAQADGSGSRQLSNASVDIDDFAWNPSGTSIIIRTRPALAEEREAIAKEGLRGFHYDDRWSPVASNHPWPSEPKPSVFTVVDLDGRARPADASERDPLEHPGGATGVDAEWWASSPAGLAWVAPATPERNRAQGEIQARLGNGSESKCVAAACKGSFKGLWWSADRSSLWFLRKEGWGGSEIGLYSWRLGSGSPKQIFHTRDLLLGCTPANGGLVCALEQSSRPRRIVSIRASGKIEEVFDPNPEFTTLTLGSVKRLEWKNDRGIEIYGDVVLPAGWQPTSGPLPLVIVQYQTRGFLRGGTDDEFPIFPLAAEGFAVLSLERPGYVADQHGPLDAQARIKLNYEDWADRKSVLSAFRSGIDLLAKQGIVDPVRVGITGLSDGTASAQFALVSSKLFAAASLTACCEDPKTMMPLLGNNGTAQMRRFGYPAYTEDGSGFWKPYSMARNAKTMRTPLLMQSADDEYLMALETYASLRDVGTPVDLFVFPDEHHMKWQPAHRLAIYRRNMAWFSYWLTGTAGRYADQVEVARWAAMRDQPKAAVSE